MLDIVVPSQNAGLFCCTFEGTELVRFAHEPTSKVQSQNAGHSCTFGRRLVLLAQFPRSYVRKMLDILQATRNYFQKIGYAFLHDNPAASSVSKTPAEQRVCHANR